MGATVMDCVGRKPTLLRFWLAASLVLLLPALFVASDAEKLFPFVVLHGEFRSAACFVWINFTCGVTFTFRSSTFDCLRG